MRLLELLDKVANYNVIFKSSDYFRAVFYVALGTPNKRRYDVEIDILSAGESAETLDKRGLTDNFSSVANDDDVVMFVVFDSEIPNGDGYHHQSTDKITGLGNQFEVMATVVKIIQEAKSIYNPQWLLFGASEPSRRKLYVAIAKRLGYNPIEFRRSPIEGTGILIRL